MEERVTRNKSYLSNSKYTRPTMQSAVAFNSKRQIWNSVVPIWSQLSFRQGEATRNLSLANLRFLFPPVMALCAHFVNGMTIRELLELLNRILDHWSFALEIGILAMI